MERFLFILAVTLVVLAVVGRVADMRAGRGDREVTPGLALLPGDFKYQSPSGNVRVYVPITTSIVLSIVMTLLMRFFS